MKPEDPCHSLGDPSARLPRPDHHARAPRRFGARIPSRPPTPVSAAVIGRGCGSTVTPDSTVGWAVCALTNAGKGMIALTTSAATLKAGNALVRSAPELIHIPSNGEATMGPTCCPSNLEANRML